AIRERNINTAIYEFLNDNKQLKNMRIDSRLIQPGDIFIAVPGKTTDGRQYIAQAIANGAAAIFYEPAGCVIHDNGKVPCIAVDNLIDLVPELAATYYAHPSQQLNVLGVTGTNGKTSTAHYIAQLLAAVNLKSGVMGTLGNGVYPDLIPSPLTTSDCCTIQHQLQQFVQQGAQYVTMEVSSQGLDQARLMRTQIETGIFTNLSQDHLDYHKDMQDYFAAKCKLFTDFALKHAVINIDDMYGQQLLNLIPPQTTVITYSLSNDAADVYLIGDIVHTPWGSGVLRTNLIGRFNVSNVLAALACCALQGMSLAQILQAAQQLKPVLGRMELITAEDAAAPKVVVDYAHTPDALIKALQTLREYKPNTLYCVFGCGGDRDRKKRPLMMEAVVAHSDQIIITRDNPRTEDAQQIVADMLANTELGPHISIELDRAAAIKQTIAKAKYGDIILIAGKGHEDYQIIGTTVYPFSDQQVAHDTLRHPGRVLREPGSIK
ncbi:MAG TPA: UDP-N-acetylmuramoyl-L-alanyl-D-glutamate--2,6-diaminopimelate ligase, partial [Gammaproteobacteria bacterium]|nr:UDP-N-acetylmuramoyl-L-alanyl-D-glutamate--2,6-diaminopimelate ligase [Gammaproteobacteria bacterium]